MEKTTVKQIIFLLSIAFLIIALLGILLQIQVQAQELTRDLDARQEKLIEKLYQEYDLEDARLFRGDTSIRQEEIIDDDVVVSNGTIYLAGEILGDLIVLMGDIEIDSMAYVAGDVVTLDGRVWQHSGATVEGDIVELSSGNRLSVPKTDEKRIRHKAPRPESSRTPRARDARRRDRDPERYSYYGWHDEDWVYATYDRVDGFTIGLSLPEQQWWYRRRSYALRGRGGYSFASQRGHYEIGLERRFGDRFHVDIGGLFQDQTKTNDEWMITDVENSLAALFLKEDFRDYYRRIGYQFYVSPSFFHTLQLGFGYHNYHVENVNKETNWSIFGGDKKFRDNPAALWSGFMSAEGEQAAHIQSFVVDLSFDSRDHKTRSRQGLYLQAFAEKAGEGLDSDVDFERVILDLRRYQPLGWNEHLLLRLRAATSTGWLPPGYWFDLGGLSSLRGFDHKEFTGNRMVLANVEYHLSRLDEWFILEDLDIILFLDSGKAWFTHDPEILASYPFGYSDAVPESLDEGFEDLTFESLHTDWGVAIADPDNYWRINFARRTGDVDSDFVVTFRIARPF
jgi:hypothetical protein